MTGINNLIEHIRLKQFEITNISSAKNRLIRILNNEAKNGRIPPSKYIFLTGSYGRKTKINPLDDVDIFYVMDYGMKENENEYLINTSFDFGYKCIECNDGDSIIGSILKAIFGGEEDNFCSAYMPYPNEKISSKKILELIKRGLIKNYPNSEIRRNGEVVNVYLKTYGVGFDIVPAFYINNEDYYLIPAGGKSTKWKKSNPKKDEEILKKLNDKHNGKLKDIIRIIKYWFRKKKIKSLRSYHLESICYYMFKNKKNSILTYENGLLHFYKYIGIKPYLTYLKSCPDPTNLSGDLSSGLSDEDINKIISEARTARKYLKKGGCEFVRYIEPELY
jgi:hypothetical protein